MRLSVRGFLICVAIAFFLLGAAYTHAFTYIADDHILRLINEKEDRIALIGTVVTPVETKTYHGKKKTLTSFVLDVKKIRRYMRDTQYQRRWIRSRGKVHVSAFNLYSVHNTESEARNNLQPILQYGDTIRLWGTLTKPNRVRNPGEFDYRAYLEKQGIYVLMYVYGAKSVRNFTHMNKSSYYDRDEGISLYSRFLRSVFSLRDGINTTIDAHIDYPYNTILTALLTGSRRSIPPEVRNTFQKTGTVHVLAISGLHVSLIVGAVYILCLWMHINRFMRTCICIIVLLFYTVLVGLRYPVLRASMMGLVLLLGSVLDRKVTPLYGISLAALTICAINPLSLLMPGFQLSFGAVLSIFYIFPHMRFFHRIDTKNKFVKICHRLILSISLSWSIMIGIAPLVAFHFHILTLLSLIGNIFVIPLIAFILMTGIFFIIIASIFPACAQIVAVAPYCGLFLLCEILDSLSQLDWTTWHIARFPAVILFVYYGTIVVILFAKHKAIVFARKALLSTSVLLLFTYLVISPRFDNEQIIFLATNQTGSAIIQNGSDAILINTGRGRTGADTRWIIVPALISQGINHLQTIIASSSYKDDWAGVQTIASLLPIKNTMIPADIDADNEENRIKKVCDREEIVFTSNIQIENIGSEEKRRREIQYLHINFGEDTILFCPRVEEGFMSVFEDTTGDYEYLYCPAQLITKELLAICKKHSLKGLIIWGSLSDDQEKLLQTVPTIKTLSLSRGAIIGRLNKQKGLYFEQYDYKGRKNKA